MENIDDVSEMDIDVSDDDVEEEDISLKDQNYTHLEATEEMDVMISYMTENDFPLWIFNSLDIFYWNAQHKSSKGKKKEPSIYSFFNGKQ